MLNRFIIVFSVALVAFAPLAGAFPLGSSISKAADEDFCYRAAQAVENHLRLGRDASGEPRAVAYTRQLIRNWRQGDRGLYLSISSQYPQNSGKFMPISRILKAGLALTSDPIVIHSTEELRFIPYSQNGTDIVLMTGEGGILLDDAKAKAVVAVANRNHLHIHVLWLWNNPDIWQAAEQATRLARVSQLTSGRFLDLPPMEPHCGR